MDQSKDYYKKRKKLEEKGFKFISSINVCIPIGHPLYEEAMAAHDSAIFGMDKAYVLYCKEKPTS